MAAPPDINNLSKTHQSVRAGSWRGRNPDTGRAEPAGGGSGAGELGNNHPPAQPMQGSSASSLSPAAMPPLSPAAMPPLRPQQALAPEERRRSDCSSLACDPITWAGD